MTRDQVIARARSAVGRGVRYRMGGGSLDPISKSPAGPDGSCDCSAFACWAVGLSKYQPQARHVLGTEWLNTDGIYRGAHIVGAFFRFLESPEPGCLVVYPSSRYAGQPGPKIGHVGVVVAPGRVVHCSSGNDRYRGDAIRETDMAVFDRVSYTIAVWCTRLHEPA